MELTIDKYRAKVRNYALLRRPLLHLLVLTLLIMFSIFCYCPHKSIEKRNFLDEIPQNDQIALEHLFRTIIINGQLGYTLVGNKPVSIAEFSNKKSLFSEVQSEFPLKEWNVWEKYSYKFHTRNFLLYKTNETLFKGVEKVYVLLINKKSFIDSVNNHLVLFKQVLGESITPELILTRVEKTHDLYQALNEDEELYGILLGFGAKNSKFYKRRNELRSVLNTNEILFPSKFLNYSLFYPKSNSCFGSHLQELLQLENQCMAQGDWLENGNLFSPVPPVEFISVKNSKETETLVKEYSYTRKEIVKLIYNSNFLAKCLEILD